MARKKNYNISRRRFIQVAGATGLASVVCIYGGCNAAGSRRGKSGAKGKKVIVLGIDGLDPRLSEQMMDQGRLPNLNRLRQAGGYSRLGTSIPPQSPVAWANFITGADAGEHGIFDFIHREPGKQCSPFYSAAQTVESDEGWEVGDHRIPLSFWPFNHSVTQTLLRREGTPFWDYLDQAGIPSWFYDIPSNYPPSASPRGNQCCLSGMGTPDLLGSYGTYQLFSSRLRKPKEKSGGKHKPLVFKNNAATATLTGPLNTLLKEPQDMEVEFQVYRDPRAALARIELQGQTILLEAGEWSGWYQVRFPLEMPSFLPNEEVIGICRFFLQEVSPHFRLYVSPLNIDPSEPGEQKVSEPADFVTGIYDELGLFATTGFQEDHKALSNKVFTDAEYRVQADYVLQERMNLLNYALRHYDDGLLFFYFSSTDLQAHMFYWDSDEPHPTRSPEDARKYMGVLAELYEKMDAVVGDLLQKYGDEATILVLSDHGFCNFRRQFNLNTWLREEGYVGPSDCDSLIRMGRARRLVDWSQTRAYGLGLNGLYVNLRGRERDGIVNPADKDALLEELREKLLAVRDPEAPDDPPVISEVHRSDQAYTGPFVGRAPDLIIGYRRGYRCSWSTALGSIGKRVFSDNRKAWSADHCMATGELPGVLFSNQPIRHNTPALIDLAPTILEEFGLKVPHNMTGRNVLTSPA
ncbi:MAG: alkaline phosphatase family protein [Phycisphaerae bacterium]|nr:alkaline phosphatase family protein [Phycisphaerae bacterium]